MCCVYDVFQISSQRFPSLPSSSVSSWLEESAAHRESQQWIQKWVNVTSLKAPQFCSFGRKLGMYNLTFKEIWEFSASSLQYT